MRWYSIVLALAFYALCSWLLLTLSGETELTRPHDFLYWLVITGSTVGYGDYSPQTLGGKYVVALFVVPLGLSIFALVIGRIAAFISVQWQKGIRGMKNVELRNHILVVGWNGNRTMQLLKLLLRESQSHPDNPEILLCVKDAPVENPMPGKIEFIKVNSFNKDEYMDKACISQAGVILIDNPQDDITMTTALYCSHRAPKAHLVAYFTDDSLVEILQRHCPNVECTPSVAVEMLAKSAFDPGSSVLAHDLLSVDDGQAQYSIAIPQSIDTLTVEQIFVHFKRRYNAIFIGYARQNIIRDMILNPKLDEQLHGGDKVFYIADERIHKFDWQQFGEPSDV